MTIIRYDPNSPSQELATDLAYDHQAMMARLIRARLDSGLTRANVADLLGETERDIVRFETVRDPSLSLLRRYAHAVGARIETKVST